METSFILLVIGFLVVSYLIFKFIKKIIWAVVSFIFLIILIIGGVFGLVALDMNNLASQNDFNVYFMYGNSANPQFGLEIPIVNKSVDQENIKKVDISSIKKVNLDSVKNDFYVYLSKDELSKILNNNKSYYLIGTKNLNVAGFDIETKLTKSQVESILDSNAPIDNYVDIIYSENKFPEIAGVSAKPLLKEKIQSELDKKNLNLEQALFVSVLMDSLNNPTNVVELVQGFKDKELEIYPDRFTFKLVRMLPVQTIMSYMPKDMLAFN